MREGTGGEAGPGALLRAALEGARLWEVGLNEGSTRGRGQGWVATSCAMVMIAHQIGAKATRDALFLTSFEVTSLPLMLIASSLLSVLVVLLTGRAMSALGPARLVPWAFAASGALSALEWVLYEASPGPISVVIYLHIAVFGAVLISGFWSLVNERFDPHTAKRQISRIAAGATLGGLLGGVLTERLAVYLSATAMLPMLAIMHGVCAGLVLWMRFEAARDDPAPEDEAPADAEASAEARGGLEVLRGSAYLRRIALLVLLGTTSAALLDYVFKAAAATSYTDREQMLRFFALFYTGVGVVTFAVQTLLARRALEQLGVVRTAGTLPAFVALGGLMVTLVPGLVVASIARGSESVLRSSTFRSGYELLFSPVSAEDKRASKTIIDVGFDRVGDAFGGLLIEGVLWAGATQIVLGSVALSLGLGALWITVGLHRGYIRSLERSLLLRADELDLDEASFDESAEDGAGPAGSLWSRTSMNQAALERAMMMSYLSAGDGLTFSGERWPAGRAATPMPVAVPVRPLPPHAPASGASPDLGGAATRSADDPLLDAVAALRSQRAPLVHAALAQQEAAGLDPALVALVVPLLAWDEVSGAALRALAPLADRVTGQLLDALLDPEQSFAIRRRLPRAFNHSASPRAFAGLIGALETDARFEVRYHCARALAKMRQRDERLKVSREVVLGLVRREVEVDRRVWSNRRLLDELGDAEHEAPFVDEVLRDRANRSLEHIFTILLLTLPREPLRVAFRGLHTDDDTLRGTAIEYLESVLPEDIWRHLEQFIRERAIEHDAPSLPRAPGPPTTPRAPQTVIEALLSSNERIELNLDTLRRAHAAARAREREERPPDLDKPAADEA